MPLNIDWQQILLHLLNFVILATGLYLLLYKPVKAFIKKRQDEYADREEQTKAALDDAQSKRGEYEKKLSAAEDEITEKKRAAAEEIGVMRAEKLREAQTEAKDIVDGAKEKAREEHDKIIDGVGADIRDLVGDMARKVVMTSSVNEAYDSFLDAAEEEEKDGKD